MTTGTTTAADETPLSGTEPQFSAIFDDPRWALAIIRATVLEAAHPQIGAALVDNSTFVAHPWRRLRNTFVSMRRMFDADPAVREREAARLNRLHARMSGSDSRGRAYDAMDRAARAWVVATLFERRHHVPTERPAARPGHHGAHVRRVPRVPRRARRRRRRTPPKT